MANDAGISLIATSTKIEPPEEYRAKSYLQSYEAYLAKYRRSIDDPAGFWNEVADELAWQSRLSTVIEGHMPDFKFFPGSTINVCENCVDRHAKHPLTRNKVALFFEGENGDRKSVTYQQFYDEVQKFANVLKSFGLQKGDVVSVYMQNLIETYVVLMACLRLGVVYNTVFAGFSPGALRERIVSSNAKMVICANASLRRGKVLNLKATVDEALEGVESVKQVIVYNRLPGVETPMTPGRDLDYDALMAAAAADCPPAVLDANDAGLLIFTSGTSGRPKGIVHAGGGFLLGTYAYTKYQLDLRPEDVYWNTADIGWLTSHIFVLVGGLALGVTTLLYEGALDYPQPGRLYEVVQRYRVNKLFSAPTAYRMMMKHGEEVASRYDLSSLELLVSVGEPFNPEAWHWIRRVVGGGKAVINNTWGQTETGGTPLASLPGATPMKPGSCGVPFLGHALDVTDLDGKPVPDGTPGYLVIRNVFPSLARDVFGDHDRYLSAYFSQVPGAYFTGDSAVRDADGQYWVLGRVDDVINVSGHRISTMEMESSLIQHEAVVEAAVVGQPDEIKGAVPIAFVTLEKGFTPSAELEAALKAQVVRDIGTFARPEQVYFVEAMPKTRSGKIIRRMLREIIKEGTVQGDITGLEDIEVVEQLVENIGHRVES
ncbi:acetate--CoA ligase [Alicyclobacillus cycloheptanicus]|uniref:Acetate--CoA ligase n=1 Tax=Alicyclobacillus cycloheptanicus TaxID=1457 RepID=A0ABT9XJ26_9BACL|nr:acetate--CoA ligase [Alicyclobacillus cycloheptanicus]MDQ0190202.1 acetyl-CoA synthetase [Alicyclobacillus cycloheptanicus]WDM02550.1 acetate--CoA ligase [Alicyclobacillus cycloheptanicus]